jgi:hypothetical protein
VKINVVYRAYNTVKRERKSICLHLALEDIAHIGIYSLLPPLKYVHLQKKGMDKLTLSLSARAKRSPVPQMEPP